METLRGVLVGMITQCNQSLKIKGIRINLPIRKWLQMVIMVKSPPKTLASQELKLRILLLILEHKNSNSNNKVRPNSFIIKVKSGLQLRFTIHLAERVALVWVGIVMMCHRINSLHKSQVKAKYLVNKIILSNHTSDWEPQEWEVAKLIFLAITVHKQI